MRELKAFGMDNETGEPIEDAPLPEPAAASVHYPGPPVSVRWEWFDLSRRVAIPLRARLAAALDKLDAYLSED
jgi:hypothetical protein